MATLPMPDPDSLPPDASDFRDVPLPEGTPPPF
ncbi:hypothetical protein DFW101_1749 [Solidesulfovibrio carbinoliphilus subsp. oakridgensis]|uniref:Uncharacterized protein n=1 Tax=Solidesulfovibrio carbinoliphilus subsp. oakridgensis TaxID=694327 RepID=G7Q935_9BACT|nr:hypothetical protein DFW101_1749 [Solidesulfovibrio carbinoliphilus subsp. oakridgensis]